MIVLEKDQLLRFNKEKIKDKDVILRVDFNLDKENGKFYGVYRIESIKETINFLKIAKRVVLISHFGDPEKREEKYSLKRIIPLIEKILKIKTGFIPNVGNQITEKFNLLENIRFFKCEKEDDINFAKKLSSLGEIFVNDAFSVSHRKHASVHTISKILPTLYGFQFEKEINNLNKVIKLKNRLALILGGAKISTKLPLIKKFLNKASLDRNGTELIILTGGLANTFLKAKGFETGESLYEKEILKEVKNIISNKILTPFDFITKKNETKFLGEIFSNDVIYDVGPQSLEIFFEELKKAKIIVWNGPLGYIEDKRFEKGTLKLAKFLTGLRNKFILIGGGDTLGFLERKKIFKKFKNISTGGGAMLHYLAYESLPIFEK